MPRLSNGLSSNGIQVLVIAVAATVLTLAGFETGRRSVDAAAIERTIASQSTPQRSPDSTPPNRLVPPERDHIIIRDIATVPFSELYDVLKSASHEELLAWATELERMPRGPRQWAAVTAYYKSLIQVNPRAAIEAVLRAQNLYAREFAIDALTKAAPESIWGDLEEMVLQLPYPKHTNVGEDIIWNWSRVDPVAVSQFITTHPRPGEDGRLYALLYNWGAIDPLAARDWVEADPSRQTKEAFQALVSGWDDTDHPAAIQYVLANASRPNFQDTINELVYDFVRKAKDQATNLILLLPPDQAKAALQRVARQVNTVTTGAPADYERPPDELARWMIALPPELWSDAMGPIVGGWLGNDATGATAWLNQLHPSLRDAAIVSFCRTANADFAEEVITLGQSITDQKLRDSALGEFARSLRDTREKAVGAVNDLPISDGQKAYLLRVMPED
jgi:hypothetical protein